MYAYLKGTVADKGQNELVLDVQDVGYLLFVSMTTLQETPPVGKTMKLFTYLSVREDAMELFGFATREEKAMFLQDIGLSESGLDRLIRECYSLLGLISYLTAGKQEVRAWTIEKGTKAPQAAGKIHTDFERGFIRAEVVSFDTLMECGSMTAAKEKGLVRSEGKEYVMQDGDIVLFRFNV